MCKTYRDCFLEEMQKHNECFEDVKYRIGKGFDHLDETVLEHTDATQPELDIVFHVYTDNWLYCLRYFEEYEINLHWYVISLPLPNNPQFKDLAIKEKP